VIVVFFNAVTKAFLPTVRLAAVLGFEKRQPTTAAQSIADAQDKIKC
jgi:hypothetical protein